VWLVRHSFVLLPALVSSVGRQRNTSLSDNGRAPSPGVLPSILCRLLGVGPPGPSFPHVRQHMVPRARAPPEAWRRDWGSNPAVGERVRAQHVALSRGGHGRLVSADVRPPRDRTASSGRSSSSSASARPSSVPSRSPTTHLAIFFSANEMNTRLSPPIVWTSRDNSDHVTLGGTLTVSRSTRPSSRLPCQWLPVSVSVPPFSLALSLSLGLGIRRPREYYTVKAIRRAYI